MAIDFNAMKQRLSSLQNTQRKSDLIWKPQPGEYQIRLLPYQHDNSSPFIELYFHYNINNRTYLSPSSFGRPDPIVEFSQHLKRMGTKEDWKTAKQMEPKLRTFAPIIIRGSEHEGIKFWGFGKTVYQELLGYIADPDYGDITDAKTGRDITVKFTSAESAGTSFPTTNIRIKPKESVLCEDQALLDKFVNQQPNITSLYEELSYDELKSVLQGWLNPSSQPEEKPSEPESQSQDILSKATGTSAPIKKAEVEPEKKEAKPVSSKANINDVANTFNELFKGKQ